MKMKSEVKEDPVVAEVRRIRAELSSDYWKPASARNAARKRGRSAPHPHSGNASTA